jgi:tryptophan synthase alpha chain
MRLIEKIREVNLGGCGVHMPHVYVGDPCIEFSERMIEVMAENGGDILEIGIPFSDPVADGPTFQAVCQRALENGVTPSDCFDLVRRFRAKGYSNPVVLTTYYNIPYSMGLQFFVNQLSESGVDGLIIPNMPVEESDPIVKIARDYNIDVIFQIAPTTTDKRLEKIVEGAEGFLYIINIEGVTGARDSIQASTVKLIQRVRNYTDLPLLAGFGVSSGTHAEYLMKAGANGVIAGSVYADLYKNSSNLSNSLDEIALKLCEIKSSCVIPSE